MAQKRKLNDEKITLESIRNELSSDFNATYEELLIKLKGKSKCKRLKRVGEAQFYNANLDLSMEMENNNTRLCFSEINLLILEVLKDVDLIIDEKFQENFCISMKEKVLKAINKLYSTKQCDAQGNTEDNKASNTILGCSDGDADEKKILEKLKDLSKFCAENLIDIRNQVIGIPFEEHEISAVSTPKKDISTESEVRKPESATTTHKEKNSSKKKVKELESAVASKKNVSSESKTEKLNNDRICAENLIDIRNQVIGIPLEENEVSAVSTPKKDISTESKVEKVDSDAAKQTISSESKVKKLESITTTHKEKNSSKKKVKKLESTVTSKKNASGNIDDGHLSCTDSLSSVHTSDLSSFDDEMVLSSDEETGDKRRKLSMKEVEARLAELSAKKLAAEEMKQNQVKEDMSYTKTPVNESPRKTLSQRVRKPNSKYSTDVIQIPLKKSFIEKDSTPLPRKRGRPSKHPT